MHTNTETAQITPAPSQLSNESKLDQGPTSLVKFPTKVSEADNHRASVAQSANQAKQMIRSVANFSSGNPEVAAAVVRATYAVEKSSLAFGVEDAIKERELTKKIHGEDFVELQNLAIRLIGGQNMDSAASPVPLIAKLAQHVPNATPILRMVAALTTAATIMAPAFKVYRPKTGLYTHLNMMIKVAAQTASGKGGAVALPRRLISALDFPAMLVGRIASPEGFDDMFDSSHAVCQIEDEAGLTIKAADQVRAERDSLIAARKLEVFSAAGTKLRARAKASVFGIPQVKVIDSPLFICMEVSTPTRLFGTLAGNAAVALSGGANRTLCYAEPQNAETIGWEKLPPRPEEFEALIADTLEFILAIHGCGPFGEGGAATNPVLGQFMGRPRGQVITAYRPALSDGSLSNWEVPTDPIERLSYLADHYVEAFVQPHAYETGTIGKERMWQRIPALLSPIEMQLDSEAEEFIEAVIAPVQRHAKNAGDMFNTRAIEYTLKVAAVFAFARTAPSQSLVRAARPKPPVISRDDAALAFQLIEFGLSGADAAMSLFEPEDEISRLKGKILNYLQMHSGQEYKSRLKDRVSPRGDSNAYNAALMQLLNSDGKLVFVPRDTRQPNGPGTILLADRGHAVDAVPQAA